MPNPDSHTAPQSADVAPLLAAARLAIAELRYCWAVTAAEDGGANARIVMPYASQSPEDEWTCWFLTRRGSRKMIEMNRSGHLTLAYQMDGGDLYVALVGRCQLIDERETVRRFWKAEWDAHFAPGYADTNMIAVRTAIDRIEIHARGITREPFGFGRTLIERQSDGGWRLAA